MPPHYGEMTGHSGQHPRIWCPVCRLPRERTQDEHERIIYDRTYPPCLNVNVHVERGAADLQVMEDVPPSDAQ